MTSTAAKVLKTSTAAEVLKNYIPAEVFKAATLQQLDDKIDGIVKSIDFMKSQMSKKGDFQVNKIDPSEIIGPYGDVNANKIDPSEIIDPYPYPL
ncbi:6259_t:CDS:2, partial [Racocetra fulgida]